MPQEISTILGFFQAMMFAPQVCCCRLCWSARRERVLDLVFLGKHFLRRWPVLDCPLDRFLRGAVIVFLDLGVVLGFPMDEHADADEQIVGLALRDRTVG